MGAFQQTTLKVQSSDGLNFILLEPLVYICNDGRCLRAAMYSTTDGASTPKIIWNIIPPFGKGWFSYIMHDAAYRDTLEILNEPSLTFDKITLNEKQSNDLLLECMDSQGVSAIERDAIFDAVAGFGQSSFDNDRKIVSAGGKFPLTNS